MANTNTNGKKARMHSFIIGLIYMAAVLGTLYVDPRCIYIAAAVAGLQIISLVSNFCPVSFILNKIMSGGDKVMNGPGA